VLRITLPLCVVDVFDGVRQRAALEPGNNEFSGLFLPWVASIFEMIREAPLLRIAIL
jgi:hypothetical protein